MLHHDSDAGDGSRTVGSVLVVGAGIAGMQAALDCADAGFKVYLLEQQPSIGGNMAKLDKTFPTNDCAMCMISPKLVETGRHLNIEIISYADLMKVEGEAGDFTVRVRRRARFVDEEKCNGCGDCEQVCPARLENGFDERLSARTAIYRLYPQAIPNVFTIAKQGVSPCRLNCPDGVNAQGYVALIAQRKYEEALALIRETNPLPGSCGMVCAHPCEDACHRAQVDQPISICALKRFVFEQVEDKPGPAADVLYPQKVAVIGSGPAGLSCAYHVRQMGYEATVFEAASFAGGMLRVAIPDFRLPPAVVDRDVDFIRNTGVEIKLNTRVGTDVSFDDLNEEYDAVFVASGAPRPRELSVPGMPEESLDGKLMYAIHFLKDIKLGNDVEVGARVAVVGAGHTAWDVAVSAKRLGAQRVALIELRSEEELGGVPEDAEIAFEEGMDFHYLTTITKVNNSSDGHPDSIECTRMQAGEADESSRRKLVPVEGTEFTLPVDTLIIAIGQYSDLSFLPEEVERTQAGNVAVDDETLATNSPGIFAGGDVAFGPDVLIKGIAAGRRAAVSIDRYLKGEVLGPVQLTPAGQEAEFEEKRRAPQNRFRLFGPAGPSDREELEAIALQEAERCLACGGCCFCLECVKACKAEAVDHDMADQTLDLKVGAIVLTNGYDQFDASLKSEYGFGRYPNVVTSMQFERILSASGPYKGHLQRPSDGRVPRKIAWIQCVGSRDVSVGNDYCSSVCCMYATKEAIIAKEHENAVEPTIFYTDLRAFGKGFEGFYHRAREAAGVRFVRSQVSSLKENPENQSLIVRYIGEQGGGVVEEEFDIVVLSIGLVAHHTAGGLAELVGIDCNRFGFARSSPLEISRSTRDGVFLSGATSGPKDIPDTVMQSSAAAALCGELLQSVRGTEVTRKEHPPERNVEGQDVRIGVFICHCGTNIASVVDVEEVAAYARTLGGVVHAQNTLYTCSQDTQEMIKETIREKDLNRVIVASCTPRTHEPLFHETLREAGLNEYLFEMVNIREQCSWVHQHEHDSATGKAKALIRGGVGKAHLLEPLQLSQVGVTKAALVIGGGVSGMRASLSLGRQGFDVHLVEKEAELGGNLRHIRRSLEGHDWQEYLATTVAEVEAHARIEVYLNAEVDETAGFVGNFTTRLKGTPGELRHGVIVVATGADEWQPEDFLYGGTESVVTQRELEARIEQGLSCKSVAMIQCVGSRNEEREYCSRVCCGQAVKNALAIKERDPAATVYILYRDMRTYAFREEYYRKAREQGVMFIRFPDEQYPRVSSNGGGIALTVRDDTIGEDIELKVDLVALSAAAVPPRESNERLSELLKVPLDKDGFFMEAHVKLMPVDFANAGVFVCGLAHSPKFTDENVAQALAAAGRAARVLARDTLEVGGVVAVVDQDKCASCLTCVRECAYNGPFINADGKAEVEAAKCQGCGNCAAACPAKAIQLATFTDRQEAALVESILQEVTLGEHAHGAAADKEVKQGAALAT